MIKKKMVVVKRTLPVDVLEEGKEEYLVEYEVDQPRFEKVSEYENVEFNLPERKTAKAAGYDFELIEDVTLPVGETTIVPTGVKAYIPDGAVLLLQVRSSLGINFNISLANGLGIIDADYYNNKKNEGHILIGLVNNGKEPLILHKGDRIAQGFFVDFLTTSDDNATAIRVGGVGSTKGVK